MTRPRLSMWTCSSTLAFLVSSVALFGAPPQGEPQPAAPPATAEHAKAVPGVMTEERKLPPLLREGTFLSRAAGTVREDPKRKEWLFTPDATERSGLRREFILLPNEPLADAARTVRLAPEPIAFEASGEVFIYHGRNYLLPSLLTPFVPQVVETNTAVGEGNAATPPGTATTVAPQTPPKPADPVQPAARASNQSEEAIVDELERKLAERIDRLPKTPVAARPNVAESTKESPSSPTANPAANSAESSDRRDIAPAPMAGDVQIQSRRGQLLRDNATGGWRFVFDGQNAGGGEPSMAVLPCLALERVETMVRQSDVSLALAVTGRTTEFEGRTFLLPTLFRVARGGKGINP